MRWTLLFTLFTGLCFAQEVEQKPKTEELSKPQEITELALNLDPLLSVWPLDRSKVKELLRHPNYESTPYGIWAADGKSISLSKKPFSNIHSELSLDKGQIPITQVALYFEADKVNRITVLGRLSEEKVCESWIQTKFGDKSSVVSYPPIGWTETKFTRIELYQNQTQQVLFSVAPYRGVLLQVSDLGKTLRENATPPPQVRMLPLPGDLTGKLFTREPAPATTHLYAELDRLLPLPDCWTLSQKEINHRFYLQGMKENPVINWSTTPTGSSALISRQRFSNVKTNISAANTQVSLEEAELEIKDDKMVRMVWTLLTRGNAGEITAAKFDEIFRKVGKDITSKLGVTAKPSPRIAKSVVPTTALFWSSPETFALMEYNEAAPSGKVEFFRVTFTPAAEKARALNISGITQSAPVRSLRSLRTLVKKDAASGAVEIQGLPMRDQGQKGYCVAASCERLFRYFGKPADMDQLAQLMGTNSEEGTSVTIMYDALKKVAPNFGMKVKLELYKWDYKVGLKEDFPTSELSSAKKASLLEVVTRHIDEGLPLLWSVRLPSNTNRSARLDPVPPVFTPGGPVGVGHMRMLIGYNAKTQEVIYTDSWGAGHERKLMPLTEAIEKTEMVYSVAPTF